MKQHVVWAKFVAASADKYLGVLKENLSLTIFLRFKDSYMVNARGTFGAI